MADIKNIGPIPQLGYGTWNRLDDECYNSVRTALDIGYRHIDGAQGYNNEEIVGRAIADSGVARGDIWMTTKVAPENYAPGNILGTVKESLEKLQMDQVDLLLLHWPSPHDTFDIQDYMVQFAEVYDLGLTKNIGVSNFTKHYLDTALGILGDRKLITNQCEIHVFMQNRPIVDYCAALGIPMTAYSPLARGAVTGSPELAAIAAENGATVGQIALAFLMKEGHIVIPSSGNPTRNAENFASKDIVLSDIDMTRLRAMDEGRRLVNGDWTPEWDV